MEGIGNDYAYIDARKTAPDSPARARAQMSDRHFGIGSDGIILIRKSSLKGVKPPHADVQRRWQRIRDVRQRPALRGQVSLRPQAGEDIETFPIETGNGVLTVTADRTRIATLPEDPRQHGPAEVPARRDSHDRRCGRRSACIEPLQGGACASSSLRR
jgi:hypothetical protein